MCSGCVHNSHSSHMMSYCTSSVLASGTWGGREWRGREGGSGEEGREGVEREGGREEGWEVGWKRGQVKEKEREREGNDLQLICSTLTLHITNPLPP